MAKKWIAGAIKHPGVEKAAAKRAGISTHAYMEKHKHDSGVAGHRARLGLTLEGMAHRAKGGHVGPHKDHHPHKEHDKAHHKVDHHSKMDHHPGRDASDFQGDASLSRAMGPPGPGAGFESQAPQTSTPMNAAPPAPMDNDAPGSPI